MVRPKLGWKIVVVAIVALATLGTGLVRYGEWVAAFSDRNLRVDFPEDLALTPPGPDVPREIAAFAGIWGGDRWDGGAVPVGLAVERVGADGSASMVYAWGADQVEHSEHGSVRLRGRIAGGHLT